MKSVRSPLISPFVPLGPGQLRSPHTMYIDPNTPLSIKSDSSAMKAETLVVGGRYMIATVILETLLTNFVSNNSKVLKANPGVGRALTRISERWIRATPPPLRALDVPHFCRR